MSRLERWIVWGSAYATAVTGLGFAWTKYLVAPVEPWAVMNHPLEPWFLKSHIIVAPLFVFAVGLIATRHIIPHMRAKLRRGRRSGLVMVWMLVPMVLSGYLIQVASTPGLARVSIVVHVGSGVAFLFGLVGHGIALLARSLGYRPIPAPERTGAADAVR